MKVTWVLRKPHFFTGKAADADLYKMTLAQLLSPTGMELVNLTWPALEQLYRWRFIRRGLGHWLPKERCRLDRCVVRGRRPHPGPLGEGGGG